MASDSNLFVFLIVFWTLLTIFSNVFIDYLEEPLSTDINEFVLNSNEQETTLSTWETFVSKTFDFLESMPIINIFVPILKIVTFQYSDTLPDFVAVFLNMTIIFTYYVVWTTYKG